MTSRPQPEYCVAHCVYIKLLHRPFEDIPCAGIIREDCEFDTRRPATHTPAPAPTDEQCRICSEAIRNKTMDEFGILHGEDAKRFHDYINNPPEETPKSKAMIKQAYEISKTISLDPDHDLAIAKAERERVLDEIVRIGKTSDCIRKDKRGEKCHATCEMDCMVCVAESLRQETQQ